MSDLKVNAVDVSNVKQIKDKNAATNGTQKKAATKLTATSVTLGGLGALGAIGVAILAVKHGKAAKALKEIGIDSFKEAGNFFEGGKAFTNKGKPFTGVITHENAQGFAHNIKYENGVIKEVEKLQIIKLADGHTGKIPLSKKGYNYTPEGKLESVDKFDWAHVNTSDFKTHGFQYIKTSSTNLDQQRADGLRNFAEKKKQEKINQYVSGIREQLSGKPKVSAETIDNSFNNFSIDDYGYRQMKRNYKNWEQNEQNIKENVVKLKEKMHTKTEINAEKIDRQFDTKNSELDQLNNYYKDLEEKAAAEAKRLAEKQAKKAEWEKFVKEHPEEAAKIKAEKKAAKKAASKAKKERLLAENTGIRVNQFGEEVKVVTVKNKDGSFTIKHYTPDGKTLLREVQECDDKIVRSAYDGDAKTTVVTNGESITTKLSRKNKNGKYELIQRETVNGYNGESKLVQHLEDGTTKITQNNDYEKVVTIMDKKGNVLSQERFNKYNPEPPKAVEVKVLADWYTNYLKLCKQFGVQPRMVGVKGGAWDHFVELSLRATDPDAYESYIRLRAYRARYDETARIMQGLDNGLIAPHSLESVQQTQNFDSILSQLDELDKPYNSFNVINTVMY